MLAAVKFGKRLRYPAPAVVFQASRVLAYLPVHVPVGKESLAPGPLPAAFVQILACLRPKQKTRVRTPIAGTVIRRYLDDGEGITPEIPIVAIADTGRIWINAEVDETDAGRVHVGDRASVTSDAYPGKVFNLKTAVHLPQRHRDTEKTDSYDC